MDAQLDSSVHLASSVSDAGNSNQAPVKKGRGRPKGAKNKNPSKKRSAGQSSIANVSSAISGEGPGSDEDSDNAGSTAKQQKGEADEKEENRKEKVEALFNVLNKDVRTVITDFGTLGMYYMDPSVLPCDFERNAFAECDMNLEDICKPPEKYLFKMCAVSGKWRTFDSEWLNRNMTSDTGPCVQIVCKKHAPILDRRIHKLVYLVNCINRMVLNGCVVPTERTKLIWDERRERITGMQSLAHDARLRLIEKKMLRSRNKKHSDAKRFMNFEVPTPDSVAYDFESRDLDDCYATCDPVSLVLSIYPVVYKVLQDDEEKTVKETFWVATVVPQPGVSILQCMQKLGSQDNLTNTERKTLAEERMRLWCELLYQESSGPFGSKTLPSDLSRNIWNLDVGDRRHPFWTMNPNALLSKVINLLPAGVVEFKMPGLPVINSKYESEKLRRNMTASWESCVRWDREFQVLSKAVMDLGTRKREFVPPLKLPAVPGMAIVYMDPEDEHTETYYTLFGHPPLNLFKKEMLKPDGDLSFKHFMMGDLPPLANALLMEWIFEGDMEEYLGNESEDLTEDRIMQKFWQGGNQALNDLIRPGHFSGWYRRVSINTRKMLEVALKTGLEYEDYLKIMSRDGDLEISESVVRATRLIATERSQSCDLTDRSVASQGASSEEGDEEGDTCESESEPIDSEIGSEDYAEMDRQADRKQSRRSRYCADEAEEDDIEDEKEEKEDKEDKETEKDKEEEEEEYNEKKEEEKLDSKPTSPVEQRLDVVEETSRVENSQTFQKAQSASLVAEALVEEGLLQALDHEENTEKGQGGESGEAKAHGPEEPEEPEEQSKEQQQNSQQNSREDEDSEDEYSHYTPAEALRKAVEKMYIYYGTAFDWSCAMAEGLQYNSDVIEKQVYILKSFVGRICSDMRKFCDKFIDVPFKNERGVHVVTLQPRMSSVAVGCFAMQGSLLHVNIKTNMNAANLTLFRELITTTVGIYLGSSNQTWKCFFWSIQVVSMFGNFVLTVKDGKAPYWVKKNSTGVDAVVIPSLLNLRLLWQVLLSNEGNLAQDGVQLQRATGLAFENIGRAVIQEGKIIQMPESEMGKQIIFMSEQRHMTEEMWNKVIGALPRHDSGNTKNVVASTDVSQAAGGARRSTTSTRTETMKLVIGATNVPPKTAGEGECANTLRASMVTMSTGSSMDDVGGRDKKRKIVDVYYNASKRECGFFTGEEEKLAICPGLCIAPILVTQMAVMHEVGLTRIEVSHMVNDLYTWYFWMIDLHFKWIVASPLANSVQRLMSGWKARGVADTLLYRTIGRLAEDETCRDAVMRTLFASSFDGHAMFLVHTQVHQNLRGLVDGQVLIIARMLVSIMRVPVVPFSLLMDLLIGYAKVDLADRYCLEIHSWLKGMICGNHFLPADPRRNLDRSNNITPYVSTAADENGLPVGEGHSSIRFPCTGLFSSGVLAAHLKQSDAATQVEQNCGVPPDENIYKNAIDAFRSLVMTTQQLFHCFDISDVAKFMRHFQVDNVPPYFDRNSKKMVNVSWEMGKMIIVGEEGSKHNVFGVHCTGFLVLASLLFTNSEADFHSNMPSNAASNIMQTIARHSAMSCMPGDGNTVHIKNFAYGQSAPVPTVMHVLTNKQRIPREYFLRPQYDGTMFQSEKLGLLPCRFGKGDSGCRYMWEDTVHLHGLLSLIKIMDIDPINIFVLPLDIMYIDYEIVQNRYYPLVICSEVGKTHAGHLILDGDIVRIKVKNMTDPSGDPVAIQDIAASEMSSSLRKWQSMIYPLVHRRNALVLNEEKGYGLIQPLRHDGMRIYFDHTEMGYHVFWGDRSNSIVLFRDLDDQLIAVGSHLYVDLSAAVFDPIRETIKLPNGITKEHTVIRCNLWYPNGEMQNDTAFRNFKKVFVNVPCNIKRNTQVRRGISEVFIVEISDLVQFATVQLEEYTILETLMIGF